MEYIINQKFITNNRSGEKLIPQGIVIHETANPGDSDEMEAKYFNTPGIKKSVHAFVDHDSITQIIPWNEVSWGAGRTANHKYWNVEFCHTSDKAKFMQIWNRVVWLTSKLFKDYNLKVTNQTIVSHNDISKLYPKETNHTDPDSYFKKFGKTMDDFRKDVYDKMNEHWAQKYYDYLVNYKFFDIKEARFDDPITRGEVFKLMAIMNEYK